MAGRFLTRSRSFEVEQVNTELGYSDETSNNDVMTVCVQSVFVLEGGQQMKDEGSRMKKSRPR